MGSIEQGFVRLNRFLVAALLAAIFLIVFSNVVLRYGFGESLSWGEEVARHLMVAGALLGGGLALREGRLVAITMIQDLLPPPLRRVLRLVIAVIMLAFMAALVWYGAQFAAFGWDKETMATQISRGIPYLAIPVGAGFFLIHLLFFFTRFIRDDFEIEADHSPPGGE